MVIQFLIVLCVGDVLAQDRKATERRDRREDAFREAERDVLTLRFFDALSGNPIAGGGVEIESIGKFVTDTEGKVVFEIPEEDGEFGVRFRRDGYIPSDFNISITAGTLFFNRFSVSPMMDVKHVRIVLDWAESPRDLDAHFVKRGGYHLSYRKMRTLADGQGQLDRDDMDGFGPETITVTEASVNSTYDYYVHNYSEATNSNSSGLSGSRATVKIYGNGRLLDVISILPSQGKGTLWHVFRIERGQVVRVNTMKPKW